jgi:hypothetical protein
VSRSAWRFVCHYLEMVAAMVVGMVVLGGASEVLFDLPDDTAVTIVEMAIAMTIPMVAWMCIRGHGWRASNEMAAAMLIPAAVALVLLGTGIVEDETALLVFEHIAMFLSMLVAMLLRRDEYSGHHHRQRDAAMNSRRSARSQRRSDYSSGAVRRLLPGPRGSLEEVGHGLGDPGGLAERTGRRCMAVGLRIARRPGLDMRRRRPHFA